MTIREMVRLMLESMGADGLCQAGTCGCEIDDLMPCGEPCNDCMAARVERCPSCGEDVWYSTQNEGPLICPECLYEF